jgi:hypothetical protein
MDFSLSSRLKKEQKKHFETFDGGKFRWMAVERIIDEILKCQCIWSRPYLQDPTEINGTHCTSLFFPMLFGSC